MIKIIEKTEIIVFRLIDFLLLDLIMRKLGRNILSVSIYIVVVKNYEITCLLAL